MAKISIVTKIDLVGLLAPYNICVDDFEYCEEGAINTNIIIQSGKEKYFIKIFEYKSEAEIRFQYEINAYLQSKKFPVPSILKTEEGEYYRLYGKKPVVVFEFIEGNKIDLKSGKNRVLMLDRIFKLQSHLAQFSSVESPSVKHANNTELEETWLGATDNDELDLSWKEVKREMENINYKNLEIQVIHCDMHKENMIVDHNGVMYFIDFDELHVDYLLYDIAVFLSREMFSGQHVDIELAGEYLLFFRQKYDLDLKDLQILKIFVKRRLLGALIFYEFCVTTKREGQILVKKMRELYRGYYNEFVRTGNKLFDPRGNV